VGSRERGLVALISPKLNSSQRGFGVLLETILKER